MNQLSLYIHIPFCKSKCHYCSFNSYSGMEYLMPQYVGALITEIRLRATGSHVSTIYLGGGTPSLLDDQSLGIILEACARSFVIAGDAEVTIEANPGTVASDTMWRLRALGLNRLSLGVQSFDDARLRQLGRRHCAAEALQAYELARAVFENVSIDLLYGLPGQPLDEWRRDLETALSLAPDHISLYPLTVEEGTPLAEAVASGRIVRPDPDVAADMYILAGEMLSAYEHYEISNWARAGKVCWHNLTYWRNLPYLGFGAGAHSFFQCRRFSNVLSPVEYVTRISGGVSAIDREEYIDRKLEMAETMILGLRLGYGVSLTQFAQRFGDDISSVYGDELSDLTELGLISRDEAMVRLTERGRLLGNQVFLRFLPKSDGASA